MIFLRELQSNEALKNRMKDTVENLMNGLTEEQKQLIQSPQISQTNRNSHLNSEDTEFDGYSDSAAPIESEQMDLEGQQYVEVPATHVCESKKYEIIPSALFELTKNVKGIPNSRLHLFTSPDKTSYYQFYGSRGYFRCLRCEYQKKSTRVQLMKNDDGEEYLQMKTNYKHVCEPIMGTPKEFVEYTSSQFELANNTKGTPNTRLLLYTSPNKESYYQFHLDRGYFRCCGCRNQKKSTYVKLLKNESGEDYVRMKADAKHVCEPRMRIV